jgi:hypothetical protein
MVMMILRRKPLGPAIPRGVMDGSSEGVNQIKCYCSDCSKEICND